MGNYEILDRGITCLLRELGSVDTERFIATLNQEKFDYTEWQRERFDRVSADEFYDSAVEYVKSNPFSCKQS